MFACSVVLLSGFVPLSGPASSRLQATTASAVRMESGREAMEKIVKDMTLLGPIRFIVQAEASILEAVAEVEDVTSSTLPDGATMTTLKTSDAEFEAHLRTDDIKKIIMEEKKSKDGTRTLYCVRFMADSDVKPALTCVLHPSEDGEYDESAVAFYKGLQDHFGDVITVAG